MIEVCVKEPDEGKEKNQFSNTYKTRGSNRFKQIYFYLSSQISKPIGS